MEPKKPQQPERVPGSRKASEHHLSGLHFNPGTLEEWAPWERPLSVDYGALFAPITFIKQLLMYLSGPMLYTVRTKRRRKGVPALPHFRRSIERRIIQNCPLLTNWGI